MFHILFSLCFTGHAEALGEVSDTHRRGSEGSEDSDPSEPIKVCLGGPPSAGGGAFFYAGFGICGRQEMESGRMRVKQNWTLSDPSEGSEGHDPRESVRAYSRGLRGVRLWIVSRYWEGLFHEGLGGQRRPRRGGGGVHDKSPSEGSEGLYVPKNISGRDS